MINDIFIINLPWSDLCQPLAAPALIKGIIESHGYKAKTRDFNIDLKFEFCNKNQEKFEMVQEFFLSPLQETHPEYSICEKFFSFVIEEIKKEKFKFLGVSVFSVWTQKSTLMFLEKIKKELPNVKILLGGRGLTTNLHGATWPMLKPTEKLLNLSQIIQKRKLAYYQILGDAEDEIINFLNGDIKKNYEVNIPKLSNLKYPYSNFDDYRFNGYHGVGKNNRVQLPVLTSKGCVRNCDFCDVASQFSHFQSKDGLHLAEEMIFLYEKYGIREFSTGDSVSNGDLKTLKVKLLKLADYNKDKPEDKKIVWTGDWISRPPNSLKPEMYDLLWEGGYRSAGIGAESGSDHVLKMMNKKTNVDGLFYDLEQFHRVGIQCSINHINAHWSERYEDYLDHLDMVLKLGPYIANRTVISNNVGVGFRVLKNTLAATDYETNGIHLMDNKNFTSGWWSSKNPTLTTRVKIARIYTFHKFMRELKYPNFNEFSILYNYYNDLSQSYEEDKAFIEKLIVKENFKHCESIELSNRWLDYLNKRIVELFPISKIEIDLTAFECNGYPKFIIKKGTNILFNDYVKGNQIITVEYNNTIDEEELSFSMIGKDKFDTKVGENNEILLDKSIQFNKLVIDGIDLIKEKHFWNHHFVHIRNDKIVDTGGYGFWDNGKSFFNISKNVFWRSYNLSIINEDWRHGPDDKRFDEYLEKIKSFIYRYEY